MTALENQFIRGVTLKLIVAIIISTTTIVSTGLGAYFGILSRIDKTDSVNEKKWEVHRLEYETGKAQLEIIRIEVKELRTRVERLEAGR